MVGAETATPVAPFAAGHRLHGNSFLDPGKGLFEAQFQIVAKVRTARRILLRAGIHELAEDG